MSETPPQVFAAISTVMGVMAKEGIGKGRRNQQQGCNFRGIDDVYNALSAVLADNKLVMLPFVRDMQREERQTRNGGALTYTVLTVDFTLASAVDGSTATVRMIGEAMDSADKSSNKAQSAALKYAALQVFMIPTEGDNDADATTHEVAPKKADAKKPEPKGMPDEAFAKLEGLIKATQTPVKALLDRYKIKNTGEMTQAMFEDAVNGLEAKLAKMAKQESNSLADELGDDLGGFDR